MMFWWHAFWFLCIILVLAEEVRYWVEWYSKRRAKQHQTEGSSGK